MKKSTVFMTLILVMMLAFSGCASTQTGTSETVATTSAQSDEISSSQGNPTALNIGVMSDVGAVPFMVAAREGYYEDENLDVTITVFKSATDRDAAFQTGNLDGIMADMLTIVFYKDAGLNAEITSGTAGNYRMVTHPGSDRETILAGDSVSVGLSTSTVIEFVSEQAAAALGISDKLEKVAIPQMPTRLEMLRAGELDTATLPEPLASAALLEGGSVVLDTAEMGLDPGVFVFSKDVLDADQTAIKAFYRAYNRGVDYVNETEIEAYFDMLTDEVGFPPSLNGNFEMPVLGHATAANAETFDAVMAFMREKELSTSAYTLSDVATDAFIPEE